MWLEEISVRLKAQALDLVRMEVCDISEISFMYAQCNVAEAAASVAEVTVKWGSPTQAWWHYISENIFFVVNSCVSYPRSPALFPLLTD